MDDPIAFVAVIQEPIVARLAVSRQNFNHLLGDDAAQHRVHRAEVYAQLSHDILIEDFFIGSPLTDSIFDDFLCNFSVLLSLTEWVVLPALFLGVFQHQDCSIQVSRLLFVFIEKVGI